MIVFDIETGPLPDEILLTRVPDFVPPEPPGEWNAATVKLGNLKDPRKIADKIARAEEEHNLAVEDFDLTVEEARDAWWKGIVEKAALSPLTGQVLAIGYGGELSDQPQPEIQDMEIYLHVVEQSEERTVTEQWVIEQFWDWYDQCRAEGECLVGHNIIGFDIPFLIRRSWMLGIEIPTTILSRNRFIDDISFIDTMLIWGCGQKSYVGLDNLAKAFGVGGKPEGVDGSMFSDLLKTDWNKALEYLKNDIMMTWAVAERMGVV